MIVIEMGNVVVCEISRNLNCLSPGRVIS